MLSLDNASQVVALHAGFSSALDATSPRDSDQGTRASCTSVCAPSAASFSLFVSSAESCGSAPFVLSLTDARVSCFQMEKNRHAIRQAIAQFQRHPGDTGSPEVQIAILSERIKYMTSHVQVRM
jgi:hypothetical protein